MSKKNTNQKIAYAAVIAALYAALTYAQNFLIPGSASAAIQCRLSEVLNVLAIFSPTAIVGLTVGCIVSNIYSAFTGMPLDLIFGSFATLGAATCMYLFRNIKIKDYPFLSMLMPVIWNAVIVGAEIEFFFIDGPFEWKGFLIQGAFVGLGELIVMLLPGTAFYYAIRKRKLTKSLEK